MVGRVTVVYAGRCVRLTTAPSISRIARIAAIACTLATSGLAPACTRSASNDGGTTRARSPDAGGDDVLDVGHAGCAALLVHDGKTTCELASPPLLRFSLPHDATSVAIEGERGPIASTREGDGTKGPLTITIPADTARLVIRAKVAGEPARFALELARPAKVAWLDDAKAARSRGKLADARALVEPHANEDARAKSLLARITLAEGRADDAFPLFRAAIDAHRKAGRISDAADDSFALAFALHQRSHRYAEARAVLDAIADELALYPEGRAREPYYRGILASETGDARAALRQLRESGDRARALGMGKLERNARAALALELSTVGRVEESLGILRGLESDADVKGCERVEVLNDVGWGALLVSEASGAEATDARAALERASLIECSDAFLASSTLANLARLELDQGHADRARDRLAAARKAVKEPRGTERLAWLDLDARIALAGGDAKGALAKVDEELLLARRFALLEHEWAALALRAEALDALGRPADAATAALEAESLVDRMMLLVPLGGGRGAFASGRSRSARTAIDVLVKTSRHAEAAKVARRSRARVLASVERALRVERLPKEQRDAWEASVRRYRDARTTLDEDAAKDWTLPAEALAKATDDRRRREQSAREALESAIHALATTAAPDRADAHAVAPDDVEVVIHPGRKAWWVIVSDDRTTTAIPAPALDDAGVKANAGGRFDALDALGQRLVGKKRLRVLPYGGARSFDFHRYVVDGKPLAERITIDYPLGLQPATALDASTLARARATVIGDPRSDLPRAREEAAAVAKLLSPARKTDVRLGDEASAKAITSSIDGAGLLHYAGHGVYAGLEGFESALPLANKGLLSVGDLLALSAAPRKVVLSGCDAARSAGAAEGLGLAQALVIAGSEEVLAPTRPVSDDLAAKLAARLYEGEAGAALVRLEPGALAIATRAALTKLQLDDSNADWAAFRVISR